ncbi:MAG: cytochrome c oxidase assembly protein [Candidatus Puniceispirillaceae bacterium]
MDKTADMMANPNEARNRATLVTLALVVFAMVGLAFASVPLYRLFCQVTGFGGTTQVALSAPAAVPAALAPVSVRFDANVNPKLPWRFEPVSPPVSLAPGEEITVLYRATNLADVPTSGTATFNVTPQKAGPYFMKIECFCFTEQTLGVGESVDMPVSFFLDPEIRTDTNTKDVDEVVLSYTFFADIS